MPQKLNLSLKILLPSFIVALLTLNTLSFASSKSNDACERLMTNELMAQLKQPPSPSGMVIAYLFIEAEMGDGISEWISPYEKFLMELQRIGFLILECEGVDPEHHFFKVQGSAQAYFNLVGTNEAILWAGLEKTPETATQVLARRAAAATGKTTGIPATAPTSLLPAATPAVQTPVPATAFPSYVTASAFESLASLGPNDNGQLIMQIEAPYGFDVEAYIETHKLSYEELVVIGDGTNHTAGILYGPKTTLEAFARASMPANITIDFITAATPQAIRAALRGQRTP